MKTTGNLLLTTALLVMLLLSSLPGCAQAPAQPQPEPISSPPPAAPQPVPSAAPAPPSAPSKPVEAKLTISEPPVLGKPVVLTTTLKLIEGGGITEAKDTTVKILLPAILEPVSSVEGKVNISRGSPAQFQATVKSVKTGIGTIEVRARYYEPGNVGNIGTAIAYLYVSVAEDGAQVSDTPISPKEIPLMKPAPPPSERGFTIPPEEPGTIKPQPGRIPPPATRPPQTPSPSSSLPSRGVRTVNPLVITGNQMKLALTYYGIYTYNT